MTASSNCKDRNTQDKWDESNLKTRLLMIIYKQSRYITKTCNNFRLKGAGYEDQREWNRKCTMRNAVRADRLCWFMAMA